MRRNAPDRPAVDPRHRDYRDRLVGPAALAVRLLLRALTATYRLRGTVGKEHLDAVLERGEPVVLCMWHNRLVLATRFLERHFHGRGLDVAILASLSRDGELAARVARAWGLSVVRGSSTRGSRQAMLGLYRRLRKDRLSPLFLTDGPTGPPYVSKPGAVILAQVSGAALLPFSFAVDRYWNLPSWDRLIVPKPFSRYVAGIGEPFTVSPTLTSEERDRECQRLTRTLDRLGAETLAMLRDS